MMYGWVDLTILKRRKEKKKEEVENGDKGSQQQQKGKESFYLLRTFHSESFDKKGETI